MKKRITAAILAAAMAFSLTACGGKTETNETKASEAQTTAAGQAQADAAGDASGKEPVTLRFSWWGGETRHNATMAAVEAFEKEYPWITVECEYSSWDGWTRCV